MKTLRKKAYDLLLANLKEGYSKKLNRNYFYIAPDNIHYHQWFWDSCFHAIVMSEFNVDYAINEIKTLLSCQLDNGFIPHIIFWRWRIIDVLPFYTWWKKEVHPSCRHFTAEIQPPVIGITMKRIFDKTKDIDFLNRYLPKIQKYFDYLLLERDHDNDLLISIVTPMESGMDLAPQFDLPFGNAGHKPRITKANISKLLKKYHELKWDLNVVYNLDLFNFEDVAFNVIYLLSIESMSYLWSFIDKKKSEELMSHYEQAKDALIRKCWDETDRIFYGLYHKEGKEMQAKVKTVSSLFPICLDIPEKYINSLVEHITNEEEFWMNYPIPSVAKDEISFGPMTDTRYIWRGTTWINTNWFLTRGLCRHQVFEVYKRIKTKTLELVEKFGFCEFYDPISGRPGKAEKNFGWSTLAIDL